MSVFTNRLFTIHKVTYCVFLAFAVQMRYPLSRATSVIFVEKTDINCLDDDDHENISLWDSTCFNQKVNSISAWIKKKKKNGTLRQLLFTYHLKNSRKINTEKYPVPIDRI